mmetsp:Transcript_47813/g.79132  ORF Transcript_47813/g.79132 Transcript_47813/m.79132 type:complete len:85 (-) Transcript_47813:1311-1565(-)
MYYKMLQKQEGKAHCKRDRDSSSAGTRNVPNSSGNPKKSSGNPKKETTEGLVLCYSSNCCSEKRSEMNLLSSTAFLDGESSSVR